MEGGWYSRYMEDTNPKVPDVSIVLPGEGEFPSWEDCEDYQPVPVAIDETDDFPF
jgi:hypothetical protein